MKANHNLRHFEPPKKTVVVNISISKNESKSQQYAKNLPDYKVVVNISISKNESKSQPGYGYSAASTVVVNISISKNESKSQHRNTKLLFMISCGKYQYFKE